MSDVVDRITARLDAMEAAARAATPGPWEARAPHGWDDWDEQLIYGADEDYPLTPGGGEHGDDGLTTSNAAHIALNDPAAVLRIVAGLRAIVALHDTDEVDPEPICLNCTGGYYEHELWPCPTIKAIAAMWPDTDPRTAP